MTKSSELQQHDTQRKNQNFKTRVNNAYKLYKTTDNLAPLLQIYAEYTTDENDKTPLHFFIKKPSEKFKRHVHYDNNNSGYSNNPESVLISEIEILDLIFFEHELIKRKLPDENSPEYKDIKKIRNDLQLLANAHFVFYITPKLIQIVEEGFVNVGNESSIKYKDTVEYKMNNLQYLIAVKRTLTNLDDSKQLSIEDTNNTDTKTTLSISDNSDSIEKTGSEILGQQLNEDPAQ